MRYRPMKRPGCRAEWRYDDEPAKHRATRLIARKVSRPANSVSVNVAKTIFNATSLGSRKTRGVGSREKSSGWIAMSIVTDWCPPGRANGIAQRIAHGLVKA